MPRLKNDMRRIIQAPVPVQEPVLGFHLPEERRPRIRGKDVKRRTLQSIGLNPLGQRQKGIAAIFIKPHDKRAIHLDSMVMQELDPPRVVLSARRSFARSTDITVGQ